MERKESETTREMQKSKVTTRLSEPPGEENGSAPPEQASLILIVDDLADNLALISLDLQQLGYRVVTASDGEKAVGVARLTRPDIILMDIAMPKVDGLEATRKIREDENLKHIPVVALTAYNTGGFQRAAADAGFDGYLTKPIDFDRLHNIISRLLEDSR